MFEGCTSLITIDMSDWNTEGLTHTDGMFENCTSLTTIYASDLWTVENVTSSTDMFYNCPNLEGAISYDESKTDATYANCTTGYFSYPFYTLRTGIRSYVVGSTGVTFGNSSDYPNIVNNYTGTHVGATSKDKIYRYIVGTHRYILADRTIRFPTDCHDMFNVCDTIQIFTFNNIDTSQVTNMYQMFGYCRSLRTINGLTNFDTSNVITMGYMFRGCVSTSGRSSIGSIDVSSFDTSKVTDMSCMFANNSCLETIYIGDKWTTANANTTGMYSDCSSNLKIIRK